MQTYICVTCGTQFSPAVRPPERCPICEDERQFIGLQGQQWATLEDLRTTHRNSLYQESPGVWGIGTEPKFAIGQRSLLIRTSAGNVLWDCISLLDDDTVARVQALGGISAIAISHPHYYSSMVEWSKAFGGVPLYLHEDDRHWVQRPDPCIQFWQGETHELTSEFTLIRIGGHFAGFQVLHRKKDAEGMGMLFTGDLPQVCMDRRWVSFMYSYPNYIPMRPAEVRSMQSRLAAYAFEDVFGYTWGRNIIGGAREAVDASFGRYLDAVAG